MPRNDWDFTPEELVEQGYFGPTSMHQYRMDIENLAKQFENNLREEMER